MLPVLVDCPPGQKPDGFATWTDPESSRQTKVKIFSYSEAEGYKSKTGMTKAETNRFENLHRLTLAMLANDKKDIARWQDALAEIVSREDNGKNPHDAKLEETFYFRWTSPIISKMLFGTRLVFWQDGENLRPALYCGADLSSAFRTFMVARNIFCVSKVSYFVDCLCGCGTPFAFKKGKEYCSEAHRVAHAQRRYRGRLKKKQRRTR